MGKQANYLGIDGIPKFLPDGGFIDICWCRKGRIVAIDLAVIHPENRVILQDVMKEFDPCYAHVRIRQEPYQYVEHHLGGMYQGEYFLTSIGDIAWAISYAASFLAFPLESRCLRGKEPPASSYKFDR